jgi:hypothetical protein
MIVGNGLTRSRLSHAGPALDPSSPLRWNLRTPGRTSYLLDDLPSLKGYLETADPGRCQEDFDLIIPFVQKLSPAPVPDKLPEDEQAAFLDLGHYLTLAYSWFQLRVDPFSQADWEWARWLRQHRSSLISVLSWNYDLVAERLLGECALPYVYAGVDAPVIPGAGMAGRRAPVIVAKPHGSCNFAPPDTFQIRSAKDNGEPGEPLTYPRDVLVSAYDGPLQILPNSRLYSIRQVADVVLPGEWNRFSEYLNWVDKALSTFTRSSASATDLVIVGFSMAECDRPEFERAISWMRSLRRIVVADPVPNPRMLEILTKIAPEVHLMPAGPFGPVMKVV